MKEQEHTAAPCLFLPIASEPAYQIWLNSVSPKKPEVSRRRNAVALAFYGFFELKLGLLAVAKKNPPLIFLPW